ncbi:MAG: PulJ/GspJ family protein [Ferrimicrobium sp.]|jgi:Tfp pilus assembly protein PilV|uniref:Type II secretion system protein J n=1 Tax=Ferrimicrobium acidiphilum TaxID=121039 RepID=A0ABV3Y0S9_9ACTN|nr:hypothetical protein [Ferrimicrobium sp.]
MYRSHSGDRDAGFGIVELLIATTLTGLLSLISYKVITSFEVIQQATLSAQAATASTDLGSTELTRLLGEATNTGQGALLSASPSSVSFDAIDPSGQLGIETISLASTTCPCQIQAQFQYNSTSQPITNLGVAVATPQLFSYYQTPSSPSTLTQAVVLIPSQGTTSPTLLASVHLVGVDLTEDIVGQGLSTTQTLVALPGSIQPTPST